MQGGTWIACRCEATSIAVLLIKLLMKLVIQGGAAADAADQQKATAFVEALSDFDKRMNQVVVDCGILQGIPEGRLTSAGASLLSLYKLSQGSPAVIFSSASSSNWMPGLSLPSLSLSRPALPCPALPSPAQPCPALPCPALPCQHCCTVHSHPLLSPCVASRQGSKLGSSQAA